MMEPTEVGEAAETTETPPPPPVAAPVTSSPAQAAMPRPPAPSTQIRTLKRDGAGPRILLMPIDVELSELSAGGLVEANAEWTEQALKFMTSALDSEMRTRAVGLVTYAGEAQRLGDIRSEHFQIEKLHAAVGQSIILHRHIKPLRLPTKRGQLDWSLGDSVKVLRDEFQADYALFIYMRDSYTSAGRAAVIAIGALLGVGIPGGAQVGFASLVDLQSGDIVWFGFMARARGDLRTADAAAQTTKALLRSFPK
jgi:hypothetical protein